MKFRACLVIGLVVASTVVSTVYADDPVTITFGTTSRDIGNKGPVTEGAFQYNAVGTSWSVQQTFGNVSPITLPSPALTTFFGSPPAVGNTVTFNRVGGGTFNFRSIDILGRLPGVTNDVVEVQGLLNGIVIGTQSLQSSVQTYATIPAGPLFDVPIDTLRLVQVQSNNSALIMDNVVLQVPEPASIVAVITPMMFMRRVRRR